MNSHYLMKCGHFSRCIANNIRIHNTNEYATIAICDFCFDDLGTTDQLACQIDHTSENCFDMDSVIFKIKIYFKLLFFKFYRLKYYDSL